MARLRERLTSSFVLGASLALVLGGAVSLIALHHFGERSTLAVAAQIASKQQIGSRADAVEADLQRLLRISQQALDPGATAPLVDAAHSEAVSLRTEIETLQGAPDWQAAAASLEELRRVLLRNEERLAHAMVLRETGADRGSPLVRDLAADAPRAITAIEQSRAAVLGALAGRAPQVERQRALLSQLEAAVSAGLILIIIACGFWINAAVLRPLRRVDAALRIAAERGDRPDVLEGGAADLLRVSARTRSLVQAAEDRHAARVTVLRDELDVQRTKRIDAQQAREIAERASRTRADFVANLGHELRTPLNGMLGLIDLLAADVRGEQGQKRLRSIQVAGCLLRDVLDRMSDVATSPLPRLASAEVDGAVADREGHAAVMASAATSPAASVGARVLVAEDHAINQAVITEMLQHLGHVVEVVPDGRRAVQRVRDHLFDVVLMDWSMPEVDGVEATRQIRAEEARTGRQRVPIIALTAHTYAENRRECLEAGMDDFVAKPVTVDVLDAAIRRAVA
jgi:CheY-like chemotaxis protein